MSLGNSQNSFTTDSSRSSPVEALSVNLGQLAIGKRLHPSSSDDVMRETTGRNQRSTSFASESLLRDSSSISGESMDRVDNQRSESPMRFRTVTLGNAGRANTSAGIPAHVVEDSDVTSDRGRTYTSPLRTRPRSSTKETSKLEKYWVETNDGEAYKVVNEYLVKEFLGRGSYGKVKLAEHVATGEQYAIKVINKSLLKRKRTGRMGNALQDVQKEVAILKRLDHPNVVKLFEVIDDTDHDKMLMVFEYVEGGTIQELAVESIVDEVQARDILRQVVLALSYVHSLGVVHRDIKPENILRCSDGVIKLSDFGVSAIIANTEEELRKTAGTPAFLSPEVCSGQSFRGPPVDVWALGITLYSMVCGKVPFNARGILELYHIIQTEPLVFPDGINVSNDLIDLISKMLNKNPDERITIPEFFTHPWIIGGGAGPLVDLENPTVEVTDAEVANSVSRIQYLLNSLSTIINIKKRIKPVVARVRSRSVPPNSIAANAMRAAAAKVGASPLGEGRMTGASPDEPQPLSIQVPQKSSAFSIECSVSTEEEKKEGKKKKVLKKGKSSTSTKKRASASGSSSSSSSPKTPKAKSKVGSKVSPKPKTKSTGGKRGLLSGLLSKKK